MQAVTSEENAGPWSDTGSGTANTPPVGTGVGWGARQLNRGAYGPSTSGVTGHFTDADGDTLTYSAAPPYPGLVNAWFAGAQLWLSTPNPTPASGVNIAYRAHDPYGGVSDPSTVRITVVDNPTRSIAENAAAGTAVGDPVAGNPYDDGDDQTDDTLTHTLTGEAATSGAFEIDSATGQISVKQGATIDYETKSAYTGQVQWTVQGQAVFATVTIQVIDLEAGQPGTPTVTRTEFSEPSNPALDVTWTAPADTARRSAGTGCSTARRPPRRGSRGVDAQRPGAGDDERKAVRP